MNLIRSYRSIEQKSAELNDSFLQPIKPQNLQWLNLQRKIHEIQSQFIDFIS